MLESLTWQIFGWSVPMTGGTGSESKKKKKSMSLWQKSSEGLGLVPHEQEMAESSIHFIYYPVQDLDKA